MHYDTLTYKKEQLDGFRPLPPELVHNLNDWFRVELTYTSNALEGNTLTRRETAEVIEKGITAGGKSLKEHLEATNHAEAINFIHSLAEKKPSQLTLQDILTIHKIILQGIDNEHAGYYRNVSVRISGSRVIMPNPLKAPALMDHFMSWLTSKQDLHPVAFAGEAHYRLVSIHPFVDGNGRSARLLMNLLLMMHGYPPAIIRKRDRMAYLHALEKAQLNGLKTEYEQIITHAVNRSLDIYLNAVCRKASLDDLDSNALLKIGALAKQTGETVSTIRYWTKTGLLEVAETTQAGYQLYALDMIERCKQVKKLKGQRLTLEEIKSHLQF